MKKKLLIALLTALCIVASAFGFTSAFATDGQTDTPTNLATDASYWNKSSWTTSMNFATIDENGIVFTEYGTQQAVAGVSLKEALPYNGKVSIKFNSDDTNANGFLKVIFADPSGTANGGAMKPWDIASGVEHLALEIQTNAISFWRYNENGQAFPAGANTQAISNSSNNYIDGNDHVLTIEYSARETAYDVKITVDTTEHYNGTIETSVFYCNNILTIGGYASSTVTDDLTIKSVTVEKTGEDPAPEIDEDNLLGKADAWEIAESDVIVYDPTYATLTTSTYDGIAATLVEEIPAESKISFRVEYSNLASPANHAAVMKLRILESDNGEVYISFDDDGNVWIIYSDFSAIQSSGIAAPGLLVGSNMITITITPELTDGDEGVYIDVNAGGAFGGLMVNDISLVATNKFEIYGCATASATLTSVKVEDLLVEKPGNTTNTIDLLADTSKWETVSAPISDGSIALGGPAYAKYKNALPLEGTVEFTFTATDDANSWYYLNFSNFDSNGQESTYTDGQAQLRITTSGLQTGYFVLKENGVQQTTKSTALTDIHDGKAHTFKFVTKIVEDGLSITIYRNDIEEFTKVYAKDTAFGASTGFYIIFRTVGDQTKAPSITNVKSTFEEKVDYTDYNEAVAIKKSIYGLEVPTEENAATVKATAEALIKDLDNDFVDNVLYAEYIIELADAQLAIVADKEAAKPVIEAIQTLVDTYATITAENVDQAEIDLVDVQDLYDSLTDEQQVYVTNYADIENVQIAIDEYKLSIEGGDGSESESQPSTGESTEGGSENGSTSNGCMGALGLPAIGSLLALAGVVVFARKKD